MKKQKTVRKHHNSGTVILTIILITVLGFATWWVATNYETVKATFNGTKLYTQKEVTDAYNKGVGDKTSYEKQIADWMTSYETVATEKVALTEKITNNEKQIEQLTAENEKLKEEQEQSGIDYSAEIAKKDAIIAQLTAENNQLKTEYKDLEEQFNEFKIRYGESLGIIDAVAGKNYYIVAYFDGAEYKWFKITKGNALGASLPKANGSYIGWRSLNYSGVYIRNEDIATYKPTRHLCLVKMSENSTTTCDDANN